MQTTNAPAKFPIPFANGAAAPYIRPIPEASQIGVQNGAASLSDGFPPATFSPITAGGSWPWGADFNGLLKQVTAWEQWFQAGGPVFFDAAFATQIGGYPKGAQLSSIASNGLVWINQADNNTTNPDSGGVNWIPTQQWTAGAVSSVSGGSVSGGVLTIPPPQWTAGNVSNVSGGSVAGGVLTIPAPQWTAGTVTNVVGAIIAGGTMTIPSAPSQQWSAGGVSSVSGGTVSGGVLTIPAAPAQQWTAGNVSSLSGATVSGGTLIIDQVAQQWSAGGVSSVSGATVSGGRLIIPAAPAQQWTAGSVSSLSGATISGGTLIIAQPAEQWTAGGVSSVSGATVSGGKLIIPVAPSAQWTAGNVSSVTGATVSGGVLTIPNLPPSTNIWTAINTYTAGIVLANNIPLYGLDATGVRHDVLIYTSDNWVHLFGGAAGLALNNAAGTVNNLSITDAGAVSVRGAINAGGGISAGGALNASGDVIANANGALGRLRAAIGATGLTDTTVATLLGDFAHSFGSPGFQIFPTGLIVQWGIFNNFTGLNNNIGFPLAFPHGVFAILATDNGNSAWNYGAQAQPGNGYFTLWTTTTLNHGGWWVALGF